MIEIIVFITFGSLIGILISSIYYEKLIKELDKENYELWRKLHKK